MDRKIRLTVVALLPNRVKADYFQLFVEKIISKIEPAVISRLYQTIPPDIGVELSFAKISKMIDAEEINEGWHLKITERFREAGCKNVAWRVTEISPEDPDPEITTESFPLELFRGCFTKDTEAVILSEISGEFGSETFWKYFEEEE